MATRKRFGAAEQAVAVKALAKGATVAAAAKAAGFVPQTLYNRRKACALFRSAWDAAVEESGRPMLIAPRGGRRWQARRARRNRFTAERKTAFLEHFCATCDARASADAAGVSVSTVFSHRRSDAAFAAAWQEALQQGYARLEAEAIAQRIAAMEALRFRGDKAVAARDCEAAAEFERVMHLLREHKRGFCGTPKAGRPAARWSFEEALAELEKQLQAFGVHLPPPEDAPPTARGLPHFPAAAGEDQGHDGDD